MKQVFSGIVLAGFLAAFTLAGFAQNAPASGAQVKDPVATGLRLLYQRSRNNTLGALNSMPADKYSYKPTPDQMTFAHLAAHIIGFNNNMCAKAADVPAPKVDEAKETDSKDKLVAAATASYDFCNDALSKMDDSKLGDTIDLFGHQGPRAMAALILASGWADHYSTAAMYLRLNGVLPPSAQPKK
ncbi:MAG TPA: DinB family protein [Candidatus Binatia bacterium]|nr:DinB family protein [Candidatus Binatia bacterium]